MRPRLVFLSLLVALVALGGGALVVFAAAQTLERIQQSGGPQQPVAFPHNLHAAALQLDCLFCHRNADKGDAATIPSVEQCMFCHVVAGKGLPEVEKVRSAWEQGQPINWVRVHRVPDHTRFVHEAHIRAGFDCVQCHGLVQNTDGKTRRVKIERSLQMGDCLACHRDPPATSARPAGSGSAPTDCTICHK